MEMNPATEVSGEATSFYSDLAIRRARMLAMVQISPRYMIFTHFGINNQTFNGGGAASSGGTGGYGAGKKPGIFFHDAWNEYALVLPSDKHKFSLNMGAGLHYYLGLSRLSMASTLNNMAIDSPIFNWALVENSDQFARQLGFFFHGKYDRLEYRLSVNKPFTTNLTPTDVDERPNAIAVDNSGNTKFSYAGYFDYHFLDIESGSLPFKVGTYLGSRKVFNLGAGFYYNADATKSSVNGELNSHAIRLLSVDAFLDMPIGKPENKMAITAYSVYYNYDFGPNYLRNIGIMNVGNLATNGGVTAPITGVGNAQPMIGTGSIFYTQVGLLLPNAKENPKLRIQPFAALSHKNFESLDVSFQKIDVGANLFIHGHHAKITPQYSTRPVFSDKGNYRWYSEFLVQFQVFL